MNLASNWKYAPYVVDTFQNATVRMEKCDTKKQGWEKENQSVSSEVDR